MGKGSGLGILVSSRVRIPGQSEDHVLGSRSNLNLKFMSRLCLGYGVIVRFLVLHKN